MWFKTSLFTRCNCYGCNNELLTLEEVKNKICQGHMEMARSDENFVGICWECGRITLVESRQWNEKTGEYRIPDKYIFSKGCQFCTGSDQANIDWMTIPGESKQRILSDIAVVEITNQNNEPTVIFVDYHDKSGRLNY